MALAIGLGIGMPYSQILLPGTLYSFGNASLPTPFSSMQRTGLGTMIGSDGLVRYGDHNLLLQSVDLTSASWSKNSLGSGTRVADPSGALKATQYTGTGTDGYASQAISVAAGQTYSYRVRLRTPSGTASLQCYFLGAGISAGTSLTVTTSWQTVTLSGTATSSGSTFFQIGGGSSWGTGKVIEIAEPQACAGPLTAHVDTTTAAVYLPRSPTYSSAGVLLGLMSEGQATNLLGQTDDLMGSEWTRVNLNVPTEGALYQGRKTWNISAQTTGFCFLNQSLGVATGRYCAVISIWAGTSDNIRLGIYLNTSGWTGHTAEKISGPGTLSTDVNLPCYITDLSSTVPTVVRFTSGVGNGSEGSSLYFYPDFGPGSRAAYTNRIQVNNVESGLVSTSYIPNPGTGTVVRAGDFAGGGLSGSNLTALFSAGWTKNTVVIAFRKGYTSATTEAILALCAGSTYSAGNGAAIRMFNTDLRALGNGSSVLAGRPCICDGVTLNKVAISWDTSTTTLMISANGSTPVSQSTFDFTGTGTTNLVIGALDTTGTQAMAQFFPEWLRVVPGQHITGSALSALSA